VSRPLIARRSTSEAIQPGERSPFTVPQHLTGSLRDQRARSTDVDRFLDGRGVGRRSPRRDERETQYSLTPSPEFADVVCRPHLTRTTCRERVDVATDPLLLLRQCARDGSN